MKTSIFIVEDNQMYSITVGLKLEEMLNCRLNIFKTAEEAIQNLHFKPAVVIMDYKLSGISGIEAIKAIKNKAEKQEIIIISDEQSVDLAVEAMKNGAFSYIVKDKNSAKKIIDTVLEITEKIF